MVGMMWMGWGAWATLATAYVQPRQRVSNSTTAPTTTKAPYYQPGEWCTLARDGLYSGYSTDRSLQCHCVTQLRDWLSDPNPPTRTKSITRGVGATTIVRTTSGSTYTAVEANLQTEVYTVTGNGAYADDMSWYGSAKPPCCSSCTIAAQTVDLFYFPTPAVKSAATSFESGGYTFISPSVYIGFTSLYAFDFCGTVGSVFTSTTLAFDPDEISTFGSVVNTTTTLTQVHDDWQNPITGLLTTETDTWTLTKPVATRIDFRDLAQNCSTIQGYRYLASEPLTQLSRLDPCHPVIALPTRVRSLEGAWASCVDNPLGGFYDPPSALTPKAQLQPITSSTPTPNPSPQPVEDPTTIPPTAVPTIPAAPAQTPTPIPQPTNAPSPPPIQTVSEPPRPADPVLSTSTVLVVPLPAGSVDTQPPNPSNPPTSPLPVSNPPISNPPAPVQSASDPPMQPNPPASQIPASDLPTTPNTPPVASDPPSATYKPPPNASIPPVASSPPAVSTLPPTQYTLPTDPPSPQINSPLPLSQLPAPAQTTIALPSVGSIAQTSAHIISSLLSSSTLAIIGTQTLVAGGIAATTAGSVYSLATGGAAVVVVPVSVANTGEVLSSSTSSPVVAADPPIGSLINSIIGGAPAPAAPTSTVSIDTELSPSNSDSVTSSSSATKSTSTFSSLKGTTTSTSTVIGLAAPLDWTNSGVSKICISAWVLISALMGNLVL